jgi:hypothetical protein
MARHFETLLGNAVAEPDTRLSGIEILTEEERQQDEAEKKQRKQSHLRKLMKIEPKVTSLSEAGSRDKE